MAETEEREETTPNKKRSHDESLESGDGEVEEPPPAKRFKTGEHHEEEEEKHTEEKNTEEKSPPAKTPTVETSTETEDTENETKTQKDPPKTPTTPKPWTFKAKIPTPKKSWFGIPSGALCDVCFLHKDDSASKTFIACQSCGLVVHPDCFEPPSAKIIDYFQCDVCLAADTGVVPHTIKMRGSSSATSTPTGQGGGSNTTTTTTPKKLRSPSGTALLVVMRSPGPLPAKVEAKDDGRVYPYDGTVETESGLMLDTYCRLCMRRDVAGGMKPAELEGCWVHLSCTMSTRDAYLSDGVVVGLNKALQRSRNSVRGVEKITKTPSSCEACGTSKGYLLRCTHTEGSRRKRTCHKFLHPLCAEIVDRVRVISRIDNDDMISYKCEAHSYIGLDKCGICDSGAKQDQMLECDGCRKGYHMGCLDPVIEDVPEGDWYCPQCAEKKQGPKKKGKSKASKDQERKEKSKGEEASKEEGDKEDKDETKEKEQSLTNDDSEEKEKKPEDTKMASTSTPEAEAEIPEESEKETMPPPESQESAETAKDKEASPPEESKEEEDDDPIEAMGGIPHIPSEEESALASSVVDVNTLSGETIPHGEPKVGTGEVVGDQGLAVGVQQPSALATMAEV